MTLRDGLQRLLNFDELKNTILHFLDGLELGQSQTTFVGDVVHSSFCLGVLSSGSAHLNSSI